MKNPNMPLTKVEEFVFGGNRAHFLTRFDCANNTVTLRLVPIETEPSALPLERTATFSRATMLDIWKDPGEQDEWPLDIIGFDCYSQGERWKFVLNCATNEWIWESDWPVMLGPEG